MSVYTSLFIQERGEETPIQNKCELMDGFAVVIQFMLATIALSSLIVKRQREHPRRPVLIWAFDTSKQALAALIVHFVNVFLSYVSGGNSTESASNPCVWYFLNILLDTTIGVGLLYFFLKLLHKLADRYQLPDMQSGYYGNPPRISAWLRQTCLFITAWFLVKVSVLILLGIFPFFLAFAEWILSPLEKSGSAKVQVIAVMLVFPLIMNIIQAWLIDMLIKGKINDKSLEEGLGALADEDDISVFEAEDYGLSGSTTSESRRIPPNNSTQGSPTRSKQRADTQPLWSYNHDDVDDDFDDPFDMKYKRRKS